MYFILILVSLFIVRLVYVMMTKGKVRKKKRSKVKTLIVIGSGGHTTEMLLQVKKLNPSCYTPRLYVLADNDTSSEHRVHATEEILGTREYEIKTFPRSRNVNQSYFSSVFSTLYAILHSVPILFRSKPDLVLCNGPGTCIPICVIAFIMNLFYLSDTRIVFLESICRVNSLSLSGKILLVLGDKVVVQWEQLHKLYPSTKYIGQLW